MSVTVTAMIRWAACDPDSGSSAGEGADEQLPAASTIKLFVASAFWRSALDPAERAQVPAVAWSVADRLADACRGEALITMLSDDAAVEDVVFAEGGALSALAGNAQEVQS